MSRGQLIRSILGTRWKHNVTGDVWEVCGWAYPEREVTLRRYRKTLFGVPVAELTKTHHEVQT